MWDKLGKIGSTLSGLSEISKSNLTTFITIASTVLGGWLYIESHFASAADVTRLEQQISAQKEDSREQVYLIRKQSVEDKIFELEFKRRSSPQQFTPYDGAMLDRLRNEQNNLNGYFNRRGTSGNYQDRLKVQ